MRHWKPIWVCLFAILCIALNYGGNAFCMAFDLPFWLDSFGTVLCACTLGPVCGILVGVTSNILTAGSEPLTWLYALTSFMMALLVGIAFRKKHLDKLQGCLTVALMVTLACVVVSVPLNMILRGGYTGNLFGDSVIHYLRQFNTPLVVCAIIGQLYLEFLDKVLTIFLVYILFRFVHREEWTLQHHHTGNPSGKGIHLLVLFIAAGLLSGLFGICAQAENETPSSVYSDYVQTTYNSTNGLPCGEANDIAMTNDGVLWIGTYAGLYRYNGRDFQWMDSMDSVRNVNCLYVDPEGRLWIGTNDSGLAISIHEKVVNVLDQEHGLPSNSVRSIIQSSDGYYYIGTTGSLQVLSLSGGLKQISTLSEMNYTDCLSADETGKVAGITSDGRLFLLQAGEVLCSLRLPETEEYYHSCAFDREGLLIVGTTGNHLYFFDVSNDIFDLQYEQSCEGLTSINDLYFPGNGELFLSADNGVAYLNRDEVYHRINTNDFNNSIDNMLVDFQGNLWFASSRLGLLRLAPSSFRDIYSTIGLENKVVNAVAKWQDVLYFGTDGGLDAVDTLRREEVNDDLTELLDGIRIRCLLVDREDHLWICTYSQGLMEVLPDRTVRSYNSINSSFGNKARVVTQLSDGTILASSDTGISFISDGAIQKTLGHAEGLKNTVILTLTELSDGRVLAGTDGAGIAILENGEVTKSLTRSDGLSSEVILRTVADPQSDGVFVVTSNGLCYLEEDGSIRRLDNFPYFNNYDLWLRDIDTLFVMSSAGLYVVSRNALLSDTSELKAVLLDARRGLNSSLTANSWSWCDDSGNLYLPCDTGVFAIDTNAFATAMPSIRIDIPAIRLDGIRFPIESNEGIEVGTGITRMELFPEILNYSVQTPNVGYYLEGFDAEWTTRSQANLNSIVYTNLPAGEYRLHLAVFDSDQNIVTERIFDLIKDEEFFETLGFRLYFIGVAMMMLLFILFFIGYRSYAKLQEKADMAKQTIIAIANTVDAKDVRTSDHSKRVAKYALMIAEALGKSEAYCKNLENAALMHDIGKIAIKDNILNKPSRLTDEEYAVMKTHTTSGARILKDMTLIRDVDVGAKYHHERWDGRGYPDGLKGEEIPEMARIIGVADAFDAMTANRVYRKQMDFDYVINEMEKGRGTQFDPTADDAMLKLLRNGDIDLNAIYNVPSEKQNEQ